MISIDIKYGYHAERCNPAAGKLASELAEALPEITSTKLGYGEGRIAFEFNGHVLLFDCGTKSLSFNHFYGAREMRFESVRDLVDTLKKWSDRNPRQIDGKPSV